MRSRPFFYHCHERHLLTMTDQIRYDIDFIIQECTGVGNLLDELALLRISLRAYCDGAKPEDAVLWACRQLSDSLTKS